MSNFAGLVLAAGAGSRFGQPKAGYIFEGERLVDRAVNNFRAAGASEIFVVLGAWIEEVPNATTIENKNWSQGMSSSINCGLNYLIENSSAPLALISLVDLPYLTSEAISRVAKSTSAISNSAITVATYSGKSGHPVGFTKELWPEIIKSLSGDYGARQFISEHPQLVRYVEVGDVADGTDLDFPPNL